MTDRPQFITLNAELARALVTELQAVLDGEASYFHAELVTDEGRAIGLHMSGPDHSIEQGAPSHE